MSSPHYAAVAARLLRRAPPASAPGAAAHEKGLVTIQRALAARRRQVLLRRMAAAVALVAAAAAVTLGLRNVPPAARAGSSGQARVSVSALEGSGASVVDSAEHRAVLRAGAELSSGSRVETTAFGGVALRLSTGTQLTLDSKSRLTLEAHGSLQHFALNSGRLEAKVAKLAAGARFVVETPDAEVEVRGTRFQLGVLEEPESCLAGVRTRLTVQEGVVEVRWAGQVARVQAGEHWPEGCVPATGEGSAMQIAGAEPARVEARGIPGSRSVPPVQPAVPVPFASPSAETRERSPSALAAQTELFGAASKAARGGELVAALAMYQELIQTYPSSALAENAVAERMRLLHVTNAAAARREATRYLALYPSGFGKSEAERILASP